MTCVIPALDPPGALPSLPPSPPPNPPFPLALSQWRPPQRPHRPRRPPPLASTSSFSPRVRALPKNTNKTYGPKQREWWVSSPSIGDVRLPDDCGRCPGQADAGDQRRQRLRRRHRRPVVLSEEQGPEFTLKSARGGP
jgi:hypothetical protein